MKNTFYIIFLFASLLQACNNSSKHPIKIAKVNPDPKAFYGIELGMSVDQYKSNLINIHQQGFVNYGPILHSYRSSDSIITIEFEDLHFKMRLENQVEFNWRMMQNFYNDHLFMMTFSGKAIPNDSIFYFINFLNSKLHIELEKCDSNKYQYISSSNKVVGIDFNAWNTQFYFYNKKDSERMNHLVMFNRSNLWSNENGDVWDATNKHRFNTDLQDQIKKIILEDSTYKEKMNDAYSPL